ncbi:KAP family P-loop NTPase fold protein [Nocardioides oleivorans]|uniref:KAP family P-loop NTPase fold protein n=1 Tax=Nocardioides oleivorans TaxID=273676 RepID=UPI0013ED927B|nr:P-loop NTPase fold protein [Nocardioides oleivorans]
MVASEAGVAVWADNEADFDLLGFDFLVDGLVVALTEPRLLPLTVGVLGDWGSGKSSLMGIAGREIAALTAAVEIDGEQVDQPSYLVIEFSPWQHQDYDDVKTALMTSILDALQKNAPTLSADITRLRRVVEALKRLGRRSGRVSASMVAGATPIVMQVVSPDLDPEVVSLAATGAGAVAGEVKTALAEPPDEIGAGDDNAEHANDIQSFRTLFGELVAASPYEAVIVLIDDLDRCLPGTVVDTFEAIRLFLNTPRTAYVLALNQSVVEAAIDSRYPDLRKPDGAGIGRDYLEKMLQLKIAIPPLSAPEAETYVNLLFAELHLEKGDFAKVREAADAVRATGDLTVAFNTGIAGEALGDIPNELATDLSWAAEVTPILSTSLRGNPRQLKRFLNNLLLKYRSAARRSIDLKVPILAKLMVLEDQHQTDFQRLFDWEIAAGGSCPEISQAEDRARGAAPASVEAKSPEKRVSPKPAKKNPAEPAKGRSAPVAESEAQTWADKPHIAAWLRADPPLASIDLRKYFTYSRDKLSFGVSASRLSSALQKLLTQVQNDLSASRRSYYPQVKDLDSIERAQFTEALLERVQRAPASTAMTAALELAEHIPDIVQQVCDVLKRIPATSIPPETASKAVNRLPAGGPGVSSLFEVWASSDNTALKTVLEASLAARERTGPSGDVG